MPKLLKQLTKETNTKLWMLARQKKIKMHKGHSTTSGNNKNHKISIVLLGMSYSRVIVVFSFFYDRFTVM